MNEYPDKSHNSISLVKLYQAVIVSIYKHLKHLPVLYIHNTHTVK